LKRPVLDQRKQRVIAEMGRNALLRDRLLIGTGDGQYGDGNQSQENFDGLKGVIHGVKDYCRNVYEF
jgi:hypothetical protein